MCSSSAVFQRAVHSSVPFTVFCLSGLSAGCLGLLLPETLNATAAETLDQLPAPTHSRVLESKVRPVLVPVLVLVMAQILVPVPVPVPIPVLVMVQVLVRVPVLVLVPVLTCSGPGAVVEKVSRFSRRPLAAVLGAELELVVTSALMCVWCVCVGCEASP